MKSSAFFLFALSSSSLSCTLVFTYADCPPAPAAAPPPALGLLKFISSGPPPPAPGRGGGAGRDPDAAAAAPEKLFGLWRFEAAAAGAPAPPPAPPTLLPPLLLRPLLTDAPVVGPRDPPPFVRPAGAPCMRPAVDFRPDGEAPPLLLPAPPATGLLRAAAGRFPHPAGTGLRPPFVVGRGGGSGACLGRPPPESLLKLSRSSPDLPSPAASLSLLLLLLPLLLPPPPRGVDECATPPPWARGLARGDPVGESENKNSSRFSGGGGGGVCGGGPLLTGPPLLPPPPWLGGGVTLFPCQRCTPIGGIQPSCENRLGGGEWGVRDSRVETTRIDGRDCRGRLSAVELHSGTSRINLVRTYL